MAIKVGKMAYGLVLPEELSQIRNTFDDSQLWKFVVDDSVVVCLSDIHIDEHLNYVEREIAILDRKTKAFRKRWYLFQWQYRKGSKWTWELESRYASTT